MPLVYSSSRISIWSSFLDSLKKGVAITAFNIILPILLYWAKTRVHIDPKEPHEPFKFNSTTMCSKIKAIPNAFLETFYITQYNQKINIKWLIITIATILIAYGLWLLVSIGSALFTTINSPPTPKHAIHIIIAFFTIIYLVRMIYYTGYFYANKIFGPETETQQDIPQQDGGWPFQNSDEYKVGDPNNDIVNQNDITFSNPEEPSEIPFQCIPHPTFIQKIIAFQGVDIYTTILWSVIPFSLVQLVQENLEKPKDASAITFTIKNVCIGTAISLVLFLIAWYAFFEKTFPENFHMIFSFIVIPFVLAPILAQMYSKWFKNKEPGLYYEVQNVTAISLVIILYTFYCLDLKFTNTFFKFMNDKPISYAIAFIAALVWIINSIVYRN